MLSHTEPGWFDPDRWPEAVSPEGKSGGRGLTLFIRFEGQEWVLRHYYRGGLVGRFLNDQFIWTGLERTRSFLEWSLLDYMKDRKLPAPYPLAAQVRRKGPIYTADLLMRRIPGVEPLSVCMTRGSMNKDIWRNIGTCIGQFHRARIFHADLNGYNLQLGHDGAASLVDFDRGRVMPAAGDWQKRNLERLERSLAKISEGDTQMFSPGNWEALMAGYRSCFSDTDRASGQDVP